MSTGAADTRTPEEIRRDIEQHRRELGDAIGRLRGDVQRATDWRTKIVRNQQKVLIGAAVAGFVIGGGIAVIPRIFGRK
jgi:hypothetical protein